MKTLSTFTLGIYRKKDRFWASLWITGLLVVWTWNFFFLNEAARLQIEKGFLNMTIIALLVVITVLLVSWFLAIGLHLMESRQYRMLHLVSGFVLNVLRSIPQIVGILLGYIILTYFIEREILTSEPIKLLLVALIISLFSFLELLDLLRDRIDDFGKMDFVNAMLVCGIKETRIVQVEILFKNSLTYIVNKLISIFGMAIFLQCSIDFIISVGLSTDVSSVNFPVTLGSLLAKMDSKTDILAIGNTLTDPLYFPNIFFRHLQGVTVAFLIVFTLLCIHKIHSEYAKRHRL